MLNGAYIRYYYPGEYLRITWSTVACFVELIPTVWSIRIRGETISRVLSNKYKLLLVIEYIISCFSSI